MHFLLSIVIVGFTFVIRIDIVVVTYVKVHHMEYRNRYSFENYNIQKEKVLSFGWRMLRS